MLEQINYAVGVAPLVVVPRDNLEESLLTRQVVLGGGKGIIDGGIAVVDEVCGDQVLTSRQLYPYPKQRRGRKPKKNMSPLGFFSTLRFFHS